jgi:glycosyltransferase involved in cell wall biosynthesis
MKPKRKLAVVVHSLAGGGTERTAAAMANHWAAGGHQVTLITLDTPDTDRYQLSAAVSRHGLALMGPSPHAPAALRNNFRRIRRLRSVIRRAAPEQVISLTVEMNVLTLLACVGLAFDTIVCERTDPRHHDVGRVWSWLRRRLYRRSQAIVVQTQAVREVILPFAGRAPVHVIPNGVDAPPAAGPRTSEPLTGRKRIVGAGRLAPEKGFDLLIEAFAGIADRHPDWDLQIMGEGDHRHDLEELIRESGLSGRVNLLGWISEPSAVMTGADLFVLPSRFEGFPNALLEAMACGVASVSFRCDSGPSEIIRDQVDGLLVPAEDTEALAAAMDRLMADEAGRRSIAEKAVDVTRRFSRDSFFRRWEGVLVSC